MKQTYYHLFDLACGTLVEHESAACYGHVLELECPADEVLYVHDVMAYAKLMSLQCQSVDLCCQYDSVTDCGKR